MNNKGPWTQLPNHSSILSCMWQVASNIQEIKFSKCNLCTDYSKMVLWPGWWIEKILGLHLKKDPAAVQSLGDLFANRTWKGMFSMLVICIFPSMSLRVFQYSSWSFEFALPWFVHLTNPLPIFIIACLCAIKYKSWLYSVNFRGLFFI